MGDLRFSLCGDDDCVQNRQVLRISFDQAHHFTRVLLTLSGAKIKIGQRVATFYNVWDVQSLHGTESYRNFIVNKFDLVIVEDESGIFEPNIVCLRDYPEHQSLKIDVPVKIIKRDNNLYIDFQENKDEMHTFVKT